MASKKATTKETQLEAITIDAKGKVLGRVATEAASYLQGKHLPSYAPNIDTPQTVIITNISKIIVTGNKEKQKVYYRHSGYAGGLYERTYEEQFAISPTEVVRMAVYGMVPSNRLRTPRMNRLILQK
jgi:large subunit ribosomal protein L13